MTLHYMEYAAICDASDTIKLHPKKLRAWLMRAKNWFRVGHYDSSLDDFNELLRRASNDFYLNESYHYMARIYLHKKQYKKALDCFVKLIKLNRKDRYNDWAKVYIIYLRWTLLGIPCNGIFTVSSIQTRWKIDDKRLRVPKKFLVYDTVDLKKGEWICGTSEREISEKNV